MENKAYCAEGWTLTAEKKKMIYVAEMYCYRRLVNVSWKDKITNKSILNELNTERYVLTDSKIEKWHILETINI